MARHGQRSPNALMRERISAKGGLDLRQALRAEHLGEQPTK